MLLANGPPSPYPMPDAPAIEWAVWGGCLSIAAVTGGWGIFLSRPNRQRLAAAAVFGGFGLAVFGTLFVMSRAWDREQERLHQFWKERRERMAREDQERRRESQP